MFRWNLSRRFALPLFSLPLVRSKIVQFNEDLAVITALYHSGPFGENFVKLKEKNKMLFTAKVGPY